MSRYRTLLERYEKLKSEIERERAVEKDRLENLVAARVRAVLQEFGFDFEVIPRNARALDRSRRPAPKYWNPATGQTWSGRGRPPAWMVGEDRERYRIPGTGDEQGATPNASLIDDDPDALRRAHNREEQ
ncbi:H-NS family nucleoid-associated regulatory protein [Burkholderia territorii]|uniref:H-NS histone family protein n=1 Tax=Burkholderia territorii TaxID=1503055 RepID=UPI000B0E9503|nr:H-NS histone family protein [Burkholderia territorii]